LNVDGDRNGDHRKDRRAEKREHALAMMASHVDMLSCSGD